MQNFKIPFQCAVDVKWLGYNYEGHWVFQKNQKCKKHVHNDVLRNWSEVTNAKDIEHYKKNYPQDVLHLKRKFFIARAHYCVAPTWDEVFTWFRLEHMLFHNVHVGPKGFTFNVSRMKEGEVELLYSSILPAMCDDRAYYETYEDARECALKYMIKHLQKK